ncbi:protein DETOXIFICATION 14-like [Phalaenopsis equestris]|uniref:protein DETOXIFICATION 14-like n=1 Tax=Phalaenopsis equestris TaxID=78828 RepID=UPI0009E2595A|nr:protein DETOXIFICATION 14-like [Phalaenopsis equestris]
MEEGLLEREEEGTVKECYGDFASEARRLGYLAGPMVGVTLSQYSVQVTSSMMVGHLGELALSSSAIATSLAGVTGFSLLVGLASGLDTLCGQAYGARQYRKLGIQTYRAIISLIIVSLTISLLWVSMGKLLSLIGQDPLISQEAGKYIVWMIPGLFANSIAQPLLKFLQSQSLILPMLLSSLATLCIHIPLCWTMVFKTGLGKIGAALSISISYWINVLILVMSIKYSESCKKTRVPLSMEAFKGIDEFLKLAIPSAVMICLEWWSFELLVLLSGLLPNPRLETSVLSICLTSIATLYTIPNGLGAAASTRVSNELGAGNPHGANLAFRVAMSITIVQALVVSVTMFGLRGIIGYAYSGEHEVVDYVREIFSLVSISVIMDSFQGVLSGIARGCGWQHIGAYVNLGAYYLVGIPTAVVLGFLLHIGGKGLWIGILSGAIVQTFLLGVITIFTDWQQQAVLARKRVFDERSSLESDLK